MNSTHSIIFQSTYNIQPNLISQWDPKEKESKEMNFQCPGRSICILNLLLITNPKPPSCTPFPPHLMISSQYIMFLTYWPSEDYQGYAEIEGSILNLISASRVLHLNIAKNYLASTEYWFHHMQHLRSTT